MKTVNIYITLDEKKKIDLIRQKYKVSTSTLVSTVSYWLLYCLIHYCTEENTKHNVLTQYIDKTDNYKTSIKPKKFEESLQTLENKNIFCSNAIKIYINKKIDEFIQNETGIKYYYKKIDQELQKAKEQFWNYNEQARAFPRFIKQNRKYVSKLIGQ